MPEEVEAKSEAKVFTLKEITGHKTPESCWIVIHDKVYDVSKFLDEHPGGEEVLLEQAGQNVTENFEDVGHSTDAREMMAEYYIGEVCEEDKKNTNDKGPRSWASDKSSDQNLSRGCWAVLVPVGVAGVAFLAYRVWRSLRG